jgi:MT0933-like antitoxin protein
MAAGPTRSIVQGMGFLDKAKSLLGQHDEQVDQGLEKGGDAAKERFPGHDSEVDQGVDKLQQMTGEGDTTQPPPDAPPPPSAEGEQPPPPAEGEQPPPPQ